MWESFCPSRSNAPLRLVGDGEQPRLPRLLLWRRPRGPRRPMLCLCGSAAGGSGERRGRSRKCLPARLRRAGACCSRLSLHHLPGRPRGKTMLASRTVLRGVAAAARGVAAQVSSSFATGPRQDDSTFYEFRTYTIKPDKMKDFLELTSKNIHLRTAHSQMVGYWTLEFGGLNKVFHIWKYASFAQRTVVRTALTKDQEWQEKYMSRMLPLLDKQENEIAYLVPWCELGSLQKDGVYELVTFQMKPGGPAVWGQSFKAAISAHMKTGYTKLIGVFHTEYGLLNRVHVLWWNENPDSRAAGRHYAHEDPRVVAAVRESVQFLESQQNSLLVPTAFSQLK